MKFLKLLLLVLCLSCSDRDTDIDFKPVSPMSLGENEGDPSEGDDDENDGEGNEGEDDDDDQNGGDDGSGDGDGDNDSDGEGDDDTDEGDDDDDDSDDGNSNTTVKDVLIGSKNCGSTISKSYPINYDPFLGNNTWTLSLYLASEIQQSGKIKTIAYYTDCSSSDCSFKTANKQRVYFQLVDDTTLGTTYDRSSMTLVYDGAIEWKVGGADTYTVLTLTNEFDYDKSKNLLIYFENSHGETLGSGFLGCNKATPTFRIDGAIDRVASGSFGQTMSDEIKVNRIENSLPVIQFQIEN